MNNILRKYGLEEFLLTYTSLKAGVKSDLQDALTYAKAESLPKDYIKGLKHVISKL